MEAWGSNTDTRLDPISPVLSLTWWATPWFLSLRGVITPAAKNKQLPSLAIRWTSKKKLGFQDGDGLSIPSEILLMVSCDRHYRGTHTKKSAGKGHGSHGEGMWKTTWNHYSSIGVSREKRAQNRENAGKLLVCGIYPALMILTP